jgi:hypothetical protein
VPIYLAVAWYRQEKSIAANRVRRRDRRMWRSPVNATTLPIVLLPSHRSRSLNRRTTLAKKRVVLLRVIGIAEVGVEHLLSAGLLAASRGLDRDKYGIDHFHKLRVLYFQYPTPLCLGIDAQESQATC